MIERYYWVSTDTRVTEDEGTLWWGKNWQEVLGILSEDGNGVVAMVNGGHHNGGDSVRKTTTKTFSCECGEELELNLRQACLKCGIWYDTAGNQKPMPYYGPAFGHETATTGINGQPLCI